jgi:hypothetical protein
MVEGRGERHEVQLTLEDLAQIVCEGNIEGDLQDRLLSNSTNAKPDTGFEAATPCLPARFLRAPSGRDFHRPTTTPRPHNEPVQ